MSTPKIKGVPNIECRSLDLASSTSERFYKTIEGFRHRNSALGLREALVAQMLVSSSTVRP